MSLKLTSFSAYLGIATLVLSFVASANAGVTTVYAVSPPVVDTPAGVPTPAPNSIEAAGTRIWSAVTTLPSGEVRYEVQDVQSLLVFHQSTKTRTVFTEPTTRIYTVEQGNGIHRQVVDPVIRLATDGGTTTVAHVAAGFKEDCKMDVEKGEAVCVYERLNPALTPTVVGDQTVPATRTITFTTTYTGGIYPVVTLSTTGGARSFAAVNPQLALVTLFGVLLGVYVL